MSNNRKVRSYKKPVSAGKVAKINKISKKANDNEETEKMNLFQGLASRDRF